MSTFNSANLNKMIKTATVDLLSGDLFLVGHGRRRVETSTEVVWTSIWLSAPWLRYPKKVRHWDWEDYEIVRTPAYAKEVAGGILVRAADAKANWVEVHVEDVYRGAIENGEGIELISGPFKMSAVMTPGSHVSPEFFIDYPNVGP
jgi:hypothetical protein